jgi:dimethylhistidine N-methyltransferase
MLDAVQPSQLLLDAFHADVLDGLGATPKRLPSRWLYDDEGSLLFEEITQLDEYYPTRMEAAILRENVKHIADYVGEGAVLIEYGAGAGIKTQTLLDAFKAPRAYVPIDISGDFLAKTAERIQARYPRIRVKPITADFTEEFHLPAEVMNEGKRVAFFPGSTIGNLDDGRALELLQRMRRHVGKNGRAVIGMDLIKDTETLLRAYDDAKGVTAAFNLNLLARINREFGADFPLDAFAHEARWNAREHAVEMHLRCLRVVVVRVGDRSFSFTAGESIHTESSRKYDFDRIDTLVVKAGWRLEHFWTDAKERFAEVGLRAISR